MQHPSRFEETEQAWVWEYPTEDGHHDLYMDIGEPIKFRVSGELFEESSPVGPPSADSQTKLNTTVTGGTSTTIVESNKTPYKIIVIFVVLSLKTDGKYLLIFSL